MFNIHQVLVDEESGELDERRMAKYIDGLMKAFSDSPEAQPVIEQYGRVGWAAMFMEYAFNYVGVELPKMSLRDFNEVLFELFPRKVSTEAESAPAIVAELRAFWSFLQRQYELSNARKILDSLTDQATHRFQSALANPANYGMAKSFVMMGFKAGFDMTTQEGNEAFMHAYNSALLNGQAARLPLEPVGIEEEDIGFLPEPFSPERAHRQHEKRRKARKAQRQARKRNRR